MSLPQSADDANKLSTAGQLMDSRNTFSQVEAGNFAMNEPAGSGVRLGAVPAFKMCRVSPPSRGDKSCLPMTRGMEGHKELKPVPSSPFIKY